MRERISNILAISSLLTLVVGAALTGTRHPGPLATWLLTVGGTLLVVSAIINFDSLVRFSKRRVARHGANSVVIVRPNNPAGTLVSKEDVVRMLRAFGDLDLVLVDESFLYFAGGDHRDHSVVGMIREFPNTQWSPPPRQLDQWIGRAALRQSPSTMLEPWGCQGR